MIKLKPMQGLWLVTAIWILAIGGMWAYHDYQLNHGKEIVLKAVPVDPRDFFRGDYVSLRYEISTIPRIKKQKGYYSHYLQKNKAVYVELTEGKDEGEWTVSSISHKIPRDGFFLRGRVDSISNNQYQIKYGIESFFVYEGKGKEYEKAQNRNCLFVFISVSPYGVAKLKRLDIRNLIKN